MSEILTNICSVLQLNVLVKQVGPSHGLAEMYGRKDIKMLACFYLKPMECLNFDHHCKSDARKKHILNKQILNNGVDGTVNPNIPGGYYALAIIGFDFNERNFKVKDFTSTDDRATFLISSTAIDDMKCYILKPYEQ